MQDFIAKNTESIYTTLRELCAIPAPSHHEEARAEYCRAWLEKNGAKGVYIDEAKNVIFPYGCEGSDSITAIVAHTDTVFPDTEPMPYEDDGTLIKSPGVGDDTASLVILLHTAKYFVEKKLCPEGGILFVCNSCEEGLGNLKGTRQLFSEYAGRIAQFVSFDDNFDSVVDTCVGSDRYRVTAKTRGGHSFLEFGNKNALAELAKIVAEMYKIELPKIGSSTTTYNVGSITGGTSVNTIAQEAQMLCEYRSDNEDCFAQMRAHFARIFDAARNDEVEVEVELIGERPCMGKLDPVKMAKLCDTCQAVVEEVTNEKTKRKSSSTDCNIPLSLGVPAVCIGVYRGGGMHTREEWIERASLPIGLEVGIRVAQAVTNAQK